MAFIGVIAQGTMGSGVGRRLRESGAEVRTLLSGRSPASAERARVAGMVAAANEHELLSGADFFLSILPPGEAEPLARRLAPTLAALDRKPVYIDCNAVSPQTAVRIGEVIAPTGAHFVDAGIIGGPPQPGKKGPSIYASGEHVRDALPLRDWSIDLRQPQMLARMRASIPGMYDKAYRWVDEMEEISDFLEQNPPSHDIYAAVARLYDYLAAAHAEAPPGSDNAVRTLDRVLGKG